MLAIPSLTSAFGVFLKERTMSIFNTTVAVRPSALVTIKLVEKDGRPLESGDAYLAVLDAFKGNKRFAVKSVLVAPDKETSDA